MITRRSIAADFALAVLIAVLGFGSLWLWGRQLPLTGLPVARVAGEQGRSPADPLAVAELGGAAENYGGIDTLAGLRALGTLTDVELAAYRTAGTSRVRVAVSSYDTVKVTVILARTRSADAASRAARKLNELQHSYGFRPTEAGLPGAAILPPGPSGQPGARAHYAHHGILVRLAARGPDAPAVRLRFVDSLRNQLEVLPSGE